VLVCFSGGVRDVFHCICTWFLCYGVVFLLHSVLSELGPLAAVQAALVALPRVQPAHGIFHSFLVLPCLGLIAFQTTNFLRTPLIASAAFFFCLAGHWRCEKEKGPCPKLQ